MRGERNDSFCIIDSVKMDYKTLLSFFDQDYRLIKEFEFRRTIFRDGIADDVKDLAWKFLFQFYPFNSTPRERLLKYKEKYVEYYLMKKKWNQILELIDKEKDQINVNINKLKIPMLAFNIKIEENEDGIVNDSNEKNETTFVEWPDQNSKNNSISIDSVKLQTILKLSGINIDNAKLLDDIKQIDKDIDRTSFIIEMANKFENNNNNRKKDLENLVRALREILITFVSFNQNLNTENNNIDLGYTQGMNELASVFLSVFNQESVAYWCFSNFMLNDTYSTSSLTLLNKNNLDDKDILKTTVSYYFSTQGITKKLKDLAYLLSIIDPELYKLFEKYNMHNLNFCHEWLLLYFKRCFATTKDYQHCFEILSSQFFELHTSSTKKISIKNLYSFDLFVCLSLLKQMRIDFLTKAHSDIDAFEILQTHNRKNFLSNNFLETFQIAEEIFEKYSVITNENNKNNTTEKNKSTRLVGKFKLFN